MKKQVRLIKGDQKQIKSSNSSVKGNDEKLFPVVGIGASAGGLEALEQFFLNMPPTSGMAFVIIQHLNANYKGIMGELLGRFTSMQVYSVTNKMKVKPDCIYIIPPNSSMALRKGYLYLTDPVETVGMRLPVDFFFRSLAEDRLEHSIGVILSGMGSDGSLGLKAIKEQNGLAVIQDPATAKFDSMPKNAMEAVLADIIAPVNEIPEKLISIVRQAPQDMTLKGMEKDGSSLEKILILLRTQTGNDFSKYKKSTVYRRIERRMGIHQISKITHYFHFLQENQAEVDILFKELLIGVTSFFRDPALWEHLKDKVIPSLAALKPHGHVLRAWVPGCSTGEEAYTLAIIFKEAMEALKPHKNLSLQIFATDLDSTAIEKARKGVFPANITADITPHRLSRYFVKTNEQYRVNADIREMVVFAPQNMIKDPPFTKIDILSCRNVLIYMDADLQKKLLALFHYSLNPGGLLILGSAETNSSASDLLLVIDSKLRIYQRSELPRTEELLNFPSSFGSLKTGTGERKPSEATFENLQVLTDHLLLNNYTPASVLATSLGDILYLTGNTGKYLAPAAGKANMNLFAMAREGLQNELPLMFRKALQGYDKIVMRRIPVGMNGSTLLVDVTIQQIEKPAALKGKVIVIFNDIGPIDKKVIETRKGKKFTSELQVELEHELQRVTEELQSTREEMQTSQEELKSTNEELQSTNEELQSTNEELTTSKEEMQSLNEELHTVNSELQSKIDEAVRINNDMNNLLNSIEIATLFLDKDLNIRQYTYPATKIFKLILSDIGRLFTDQVTDLVYPEMFNDAKEVLRTLIFVEKNVATRDKRWFTIRMMPYRTLEDKIDGLVITFIEITRMKQLETALTETRRFLQDMSERLPSIIISLPPELKIKGFNSKAELLFKLKSEDLIGKSFIESFIPEKKRETISDELTKPFSPSPDDEFSRLLKYVVINKKELAWSVYNYYDDKGYPDGLILFVREVNQG